MVQDFVEAAYRWILGGAVITRQLLPLVIFTLVAGAAVWLAYRKIDPEGQSAGWPLLRRWSGRVGQLLLLGLSVAVLSGGLVEARKIVETRRETIQEASASRRPEPNLSGIVQFAPVVAVIEEKTYTRTLTLPPDFATRVGGEGLQVLSPYLQDPSSENVTKLVDSFKRSGQDVVFTRELTRRDEVPVAADAADLKVDFRDQGAPSGRRHFEAELVGEYRFKNPRTDPAEMRFAFPLPQGGGTVQEFYIEIEGKRITEPDERGQYSWQGTVAPGAQVVAHAHYRATGAAEFDYMLGSERRRIGDFHLTTTSSQTPKFSKSGIYPSSTLGTRAEWQLREVLTSQSISLVFPRADVQAELLEKTLVMLPVALVLLAAASLLLAPIRALWGSAGFGIGLFGVPVLSPYMSPPITTMVGCAIAIIGAGLIFRSSKGWIIAILAGVLPTVFLSVEHGGLLAWIVAGLAVALVAGRGRYINETNL